MLECATVSGAVVEGSEVKTISPLSKDQALK